MLGFNDFIKFLSDLKSINFHNTKAFNKLKKHIILLLKRA